MKIKNLKLNHVKTANEILERILIRSFLFHLGRSSSHEKIESKNYMVKPIFITEDSLMIDAKVNQCWAVYEL